MIISMSSQTSNCFNSIVNPNPVPLYKQPVTCDFVIRGSAILTALFIVWGYTVDVAPESEHSANEQQKRRTAALIAGCGVIAFLYLVLRCQTQSAILTLGGTLLLAEVGLPWLKRSTKI